MQPKWTCRVRYKGKPRAPYEFGCKVSLGTPATRPKGGQFVLHCQPAFESGPLIGVQEGPPLDMRRGASRERARPHIAL
jgi:transposase, IS5 family